MSNLPTKEERTWLRDQLARMDAGEAFTEPAEPMEWCRGLLDLADQLEAERDREALRADSHRASARQMADANRRAEAERDHLREQLAVEKAKRIEAEGRQNQADLECKDLREKLHVALEGDYPGYDPDGPSSPLYHRCEAMRAERGELRERVTALEAGWEQRHLLERLPLPDDVVEALHERDRLAEQLALAVRALEDAAHDLAIIEELDGVPREDSPAMRAQARVIWSLAQLRGDTGPATGAELLDALADLEAPSVESLEAHLRDVRGEGDSGG